VIGEHTGIERDGEYEKRTITAHVHRERVVLKCQTCHKVQTWYPRQWR
jgi:hypothetical protein